MRPALVLAIAAGVTLLLAGPPGAAPKPPPGRVDAAVAWPGAQRADIDPTLADGPLFTPLLFLDAWTALGTAPTPDAREVRLLLRDRRGGLRLLRRLPGSTQFEAVTATAGQVVWTESSDRLRVRIWAADRGGGPARLLTADTGDTILYGNQYDLVAADGRVYWATAGNNDKSTEIRSVALGGGPVDVRTEPGQWALSAWPWLVDDTEGRLRNMSTNRDKPVVTSGPETATCGPLWCRVMVMNGEGLARIDLMHPDGTGRRRIAGAAAQAAVPEVAVLDRFEVLAEADPATLLVYDVATGRTVSVAPAVDGAFTGGGMLWWSTGGDDDSVTWHTLDLRTA